MVTCSIQYFKRRARSRNIPGREQLLVYTNLLSGKVSVSQKKREYSKAFDGHGIALPWKSHCHSSNMENIVSTALTSETVKPDTL